MAKIQSNDRFGFIIGTKLLKTADIKEFIRLKTIKLIDNQKVAKRDAHMLNLAHIMFSDSLTLFSIEMG